MDEARPRRRVESAPAAPPAVLWLIALVALVPFPLTSLVYAFGPAEFSRPALTTLLSWAAIVVAFLGGVRWGLETREPEPRAYRLAMSVLLAASALLVLLGRGRLPDVWILGGFVAVLIVQWLFDHQTPDTPNRYPVLSTVVTGAACISLALAFEKALNA